MQKKKFVTKNFGQFSSKRYEFLDRFFGGFKSKFGHFISPLLHMIPRFAKQPNVNDAVLEFKTFTVHSPIQTMKTHILMVKPPATELDERFI